MSKSIDAYITVRFRANNLIDDDTLDAEYDGDLGQWISELLETENITGLAEGNYEVVSIERIEEK